MRVVKTLNLNWFIFDSQHRSNARRRRIHFLIAGNYRNWLTTLKIRENRFLRLFHYFFSFISLCKAIWRARKAWKKSMSTCEIAHLSMWSDYMKIFTNCSEINFLHDGCECFSPVWNSFFSDVPLMIIIRDAESRK